MPLKPARKPMRRRFAREVFKDKPAAIKALEFARQKAGRVPSFDDFAKALGRHAWDKINEYHGVSNLYQELGWQKPEPRKAFSELRDPKLFRKEMLKVINLIGRFPTDNDLKKIKRLDLRVPIQLLGGYKEAQKLFPGTVNLIPSPWKDFDYAALRLYEIKKKAGRWPYSTELAKNHGTIHYAIYRVQKQRYPEFIKKAQAIEPFFDKLNPLSILAVKAKAGDLNARNEAIMQGMALFKKFISKRQINYAKSFDDLTQDFTQAILQAIRNYDFRKSNFSTHLAFYSERAFGRYLKTGSITGAKSIKAVSLQQPLSAGAGERELIDLIMPEKAKHAKAIESTELIAEIKSALKELPPIERQVIELRHGLSGKPKRRSLEETGVLMNLTRERIRQLEESALKKIRPLLNAPH